MQLSILQLAGQGSGLHARVSLMLLKALLGGWSSLLGGDIGCGLPENSRRHGM